MKILHAHKYFYLRAGAERYMLELMKMQEQAGHHVAPFSMHHPKNDSSPWEDYFVSELKTEGEGRKSGRLAQLRRAWWSKEAKKKMQEMLRVFKPDIVHAHNIYTHLSPSILAACREAGVPVVMTVHDYALISANYTLWAGDHALDIDRHGLVATAKTKFINDSFLATLVLDGITKLQRKKYVAGVDRFLTSSHFVTNVLERNAIPAENIETVGLMTDTTCSAQKKDDYVVAVGRLQQFKGLHTLIEAMKAFPSVTLKIAGTGPYENHLRSLAADMDHVEFMGFVGGKRLTDLVARARVSVVPSLWYEPYGLVAVESMACSTPVIVSDKGGLKELVEDHVSGRVFEAGDVPSLVEALRSFLREPDYAKSLGEAAAHRAKAIADPARHVKTIMQVYEEVIHAHKK